MENRFLGLYLHIPFCIKKCAYCDFLSAPAGSDTIESYVRALCGQIKAAGKQLARKQLTGKGYLVDTVFLGGGTPTLLKTADLERLLSAVRSAFSVTKDAEISVECNPKTADKDKLSRLHAAGFNRLSIGVQSADNRQLKLLGRIHTWEDFLGTYEAARAAGFTNLNLDLISALPGQTVESFADTLKKVLALEPEHLSVYSLILEEGTPFYDRYFATDELPGEEESAALDILTRRVLSRAGYERYEISNYARPGHVCRHNLKYWSGEEYLGLGLDASSYLKGDCGLFDLPQGNYSASDVRFIRSRCVSALDSYLVSSGHIQYMWEEILPVPYKDELEEYVFLGLRKCEGISVAAFESRFGCSFAGLYGSVTDRYLDLGLMRWEYDRIFLTEEGMEVSNRIMADYLLDED